MLRSVWGNTVGKNTKLEFSKGVTYQLILEELALPLSMKFVYLETGSASFTSMETSLALTGKAQSSLGGLTRPQAGCRQHAAS